MRVGRSCFGKYEFIGSFGQQMIKQGENYEIKI